jgi:hypothetical protein
MSAQTIIDSVFVSIDDDGECLVFTINAKSTLDFVNSEGYLCARHNGSDVHLHDSTIQEINEWALSNGYKGD